MKIGKIATGAKEKTILKGGGSKSEASNEGENNATLRGYSKSDDGDQGNNNCTNRKGAEDELEVCSFFSGHSRFSESTNP